MHQRVTLRAARVYFNLKMQCCSNLHRTSTNKQCIAKWKQMHETNIALHLLACASLLHAGTNCRFTLTLSSWQFTSPALFLCRIHWKVLQIYWIEFAGMCCKGKRFADILCKVDHKLWHNRFCYLLYNSKYAILFLVLWH